MNRLTPFVFFVAMTLVLGAGCHNDDKDSNHKTDNSSLKSSETLWYRLGGESAVRAVVHDFVALGASNPNVNFVRQGKPTEWKPKEGDIAKLEQRMVEFISEYTGGPLKYKGPNMLTVHRGMQISDAEFDALAADLAKALDQHHVPKKEKDELIAVIGGTRGQIVGQ